MNQTIYTIVKESQWEDSDYTHFDEYFTSWPALLNWVEANFGLDPKYSYSPDRPVDTIYIATGATFAIYRLHLAE